MTQATFNALNYYSLVPNRNHSTRLLATTVEGNESWINIFWGLICLFCFVLFFEVALEHQGEV